MASHPRPPARPSLAGVSRLVGPAAAVTSTGIALLTVAGSLPDYPVSSLERGLPTWLIALGCLAGLTIAASAWVVRWERPAASVGLAVAMAGLLVPVWAGWTTLSGPAQALALGVAPVAIAGTAQVGLRWSRTGGSRRLLGLIYALAIGATTVHIVGYVPFTDPGCTRTCAEFEPLAAGLLASRAGYSIAAALATGSAALAVVALVRPDTRRRAGVVGWAAALAIVALTVPWPLHAATWTDQPSLAAVVLPSVIAGLLVGIAPLVATATTRQMRREVRQLVERLPDTGVAAVGGSGGAGLRVQFAVPDDGRWVDPSGVDVASSDGPGSAVVVSDPGGPVLRLLAAGGDDPSAVLGTLTPATMLALQNARLAAISRARLADVRASQRRIVDASDAERQRIERDLHDGAQQRLVSASFQLSLARNRVVDDSEALSRVEASLREALERLRQLGHGIFPATLATEGLAAALEDLARESEVPTTLDLREVDLDRDLAVAAYAVVATALSSARATGSSSAHVAATARDGSFELRVRLLGGNGVAHDDLVDVADRVGAVGGRLDVEPIDGGVAITAVLPCA